MKVRLPFWLLFLAWVLQSNAAPTKFDKTISDREAVEYAKKIEDLFNKGENNIFVRLLNTEALVRRALDGLDIKTQEQINFAAGVRDGMQKRSGGGLDPTGSLRFMRLVRTNDQPVPLMRLLPDAGGVDYQYLALSRDSAGKLQIVDIFPLSVGEWLSQTLRRSYIALAAKQDESILDKLVGRDRDYLQHLTNVLVIDAELQQGNYAEALKEFGKLPSELQSQKAILARGMAAAVEASEKEYLKLIQLWEKTYPSDPSLDFRRLDAFTIRKEYDSALACLSRLQKEIGADACLVFLRANLNFFKEDLDIAKKLAREAVNQEPSLHSAYDLLLNISLKRKDFVETARLLSETERAFDTDLREAIKEGEGYVDFRKSSEYKNWLREHKGVKSKEQK